VGGRACTGRAARGRFGNQRPCPRSGHPPRCCRPASAGFPERSPAEVRASAIEADGRRVRGDCRRCSCCDGRRFRDRRSLQRLGQRRAGTAGTGRITARLRIAESSGVRRIPRRHEAAALAVAHRRRNDVQPARFPQRRCVLPASCPQRPPGRDRRQRVSPRRRALGRSGTRGRRGTSTASTASPTTPFVPL
jgi:hypothetical protein